MTDAIAEVTEEMIDAQFTEPKPVFSVDYSPIVIIEGLPVVALKKLKALMKTIYEDIILKCGEIASKKHFSVPYDEETEMSLGYCYVCFKTPEQAQACVDMFHGTNEVFAPKYVLSVTRYTELLKCADLPEEYVPPPKHTIDHAGMLSHLMDPDAACHFTLLCKDEIVHRSYSAGNMSEVIASTTVVDPVDISYSATGLYIVVRYGDRVELLINNKTSLTFRPPKGCDTVYDALVSPCERFLILLSYDQSVAAGPDAPNLAVRVQLYSVWEQRLVSDFDDLLLRPFENVEGDTVAPADQIAYSGSGTYIAVFTGKALLLYTVAEDSNVYVLSKPDTLPYRNITAMEFSPGRASEVLAIFQGRSNKSSMCCCHVLDVSRPANRWTLATKTCDADSGRFVWNQRGTTLAFVTATRSAKQLASQLHVFHVDARNTPVETVELPSNLEVRACAWNHGGSRFAFVANPVGPATPAAVRVQTAPVRRSGRGKNTNCNSLLFSQRALDAFMNTPEDAQSRILNDGKTLAVYIVTPSSGADRNGKIQVKKVVGAFGDQIEFSATSSCLVACTPGLQPHPIFFIDSDTQEVLSSSVVVVHGASVDPSGRYLMTYRVGSKSAAAKFSIFNVVGHEMDSADAQDLMTVMWRPFDRDLVNPSEEERAGLLAEVERNYDSLLHSEQAEYREEIRRINEVGAQNLRQWRALLADGFDAPEDLRRVGLLRRAAFAGTGDADKSGFDAAGGRSTVAVRQTIRVLDRTLPPQKISLADFEEVYKPKIRLDGPGSA